MTRIVSGYLPELLGPHALTQDGGDPVTARGTWNIVGATVEDDDVNDRTNITVEAPEGSFTAAGDLAGDETSQTVVSLAGSAGVLTVTATQTLHTGNPEQKQDERQINVYAASDTPATLATYNTTADRLYAVKGYVVVQSADLAEFAYWNVDALISNVADVTAAITASPITEEENNTSTPTLDFDFSEGIALVYTGVSGVATRATGRILIHEIISVPDL